MKKWFIKIKSGSSLIELIVYIGTFLIILLACFNGTLYVYKQIVKEGSFINQKLSYTSGMARFYYDLSNAPGELDKWKKKDEHELIWSLNTYETDVQKKNNKGEEKHSISVGKDIGWYYHNNTLTRKEGIYDTSANRWLNATTALTITAPGTFSFKIIEKKELIKSVCITYTQDKKIYTYYMALRNTVYLPYYMP